MLRNSDLHTVVCHTLVNPLVEQWIQHGPRRQYAAALKRGMKLRNIAKTWSRDEAEDYVLRQLRNVLQHAQRTTPYYRRLFSNLDLHFDDSFGFCTFARLPILERDDLIKYDRDLMATDLDSSKCTVYQSGGTTGVPVNCWAGPQEEGWRGSGVYFYQELAGVIRGNRTAMLWGHHLDPVRSESLKDRLRNFIHNQRWFDCFRLSPDILDAYHRELQSWRPHYIIAYADALASLARHVLQHGYAPCYPLVCCITGAEKLYPSQRLIIERAFGKVYERYGSRETGLIGFQVDPTSPIIHVDWANLLIEPEDDQPESAILVTKLRADAMPMIRYRIGDMAAFPPGSKPGHPAFELLDVSGRSTDRICLPNGKWISGIQVVRLMNFLEEDLSGADRKRRAEMAWQDAFVREFMFVQRADYSLDCYLVPTSEFGELARRAIEAMVSANLPGLPLRIHLVERVSRTAANKLRPVMSEVSRIPERTELVS